MFTSIDEKIFEDINGENKKQEEIEEIIFSDSIILYSTDWLRLIQRVANVMAALLELGFWFRGGIGYGKYYGDISNSRISMAWLVEDTGEMSENVGHRPAALYREKTR